MSGIRIRPRSAAEQVDLDTDIDAYLRDAGIPARPFGYPWFLCLAPQAAELSLDDAPDWPDRLVIAPTPVEVLGCGPTAHDRLEHSAAPRSIRRTWGNGQEWDVDNEARFARPTIGKEHVWRGEGRGRISRRSR
ncbi:hypothetical protein GCM10009848_58230 [Micromonospora lupini]